MLPITGNVTNSSLAIGIESNGMTAELVRINTYSPLRVNTNNSDVAFNHLILASYLCAIMITYLYAIYYKSNAIREYICIGAVLGIVIEIKD